MSILRSTATSAAVILALSFGGCGSMSHQQKSTAAGAAIGGVAGNVLGGSAASTIGGAAVGGVIGHEVGKK
jgi:osmotically inducible lipoprotein OsmB